MFALIHVRKHSAGIRFARLIATASIFKSNAARKSPTPIVFLEGLGTPRMGWKDTWQTRLADQGYNSTAIYLEPTTSGEQHEPAELVKSLSKELANCIQKDLSFFPPVVIAQGFCTHVAEKYVESHPASGLVLLTPMNVEQATKAGVKELRENALEGSIYEPEFPILLMSNKEHDNGKSHRLHGDPNIDQIEVEHGDDHNGVVNGRTWNQACDHAAQWLDDIGL
ncbi:hypothetical protein K450DRAFT_232533 [Umbelopsis ramanniana AG]|uniref:Uncharacterized protein n=1 Tax=Umbelopsis ramanniana AG TaxID=1314678 RepID=A0AAD5EDC8_UMBRA|nr:uncharacterized protein K450DRAFT_232533 [Umbelopsis ramanniana AG]KAI8581332.1 hypothetical protein K450DRAFT_232533 [Umbelopsis ramanniana AG]